MKSTFRTVLVLLCVALGQCLPREMLTFVPTSQPTPQQWCFVSCHCDGYGFVNCTVDEKFFQLLPAFNQFLFNASQRLDSRVHFQTSSAFLPYFLPHLPTVRHLSLQGNSIAVVQNNVFRGMRLRTLDLGHNAIRIIESEAFQQLNFLRSLDLSHNNLTYVSKSVFADLPNLEVLNLEWNHLIYFPLDSLSYAPRLETLLLNNNNLTYLMPGSLVSLSSLNLLILANNSLMSFEVDVVSEVPSLEVLDVSNNPFHCSCALQGLKEVLNSSSVTVLHSENTVCARPLGLRHRQIQDVIFDLGVCTKPETVLNYDSKNVLYISDVEVSCDIQGVPDPAVLWNTPWGDQFADRSYLTRLETVCDSCKQERRYQGIGISLESVVSVGGGGRSLKITNFRSFFTGNITCQAFNYLGNDTAVRHLDVLLPIKGHVYRSIMIGGFCSAAFLCFGLVVGSIKLIVLGCLKRFGKKKDIVRTPITAVVSDDDFRCVSEDSYCRENSDDFHDFYPPEAPFTTPIAVSPPTSPRKIHTPKESEEGQNAWGILDTMEEVRWRLRYGVGRKMQTVRHNVRAIKETGRRNVQNIKDTGSVYVHNIMESGSTAAHKVRAGVVLGVETVKYHVQSIKEFCGTGDMGTQTISMISVETNLDTDETREVVKSVTLV